MSKLCPTCGFRVKSDDPWEHAIGLSCGIGLNQSSSKGE